MLTDEEIELGGYRFEDLQEKRIVENRTDLQRKQTELGFPLPIKTGAIAGDVPEIRSSCAGCAGAPRCATRRFLHNAENPVALPRPVGRPKTVPVPQRADHPPVPAPLAGAAAAKARRTAGGARSASFGGEHPQSNRSACRC